MRNRSMPAVGRLAHEVADDIVGIVGVADAVGAAQQHLRQDVGHALAHQRQPLPRVLGEEAHGDVEGRAAPAFEREQLRQAARIGLGDARRCRSVRMRVASSDWCASRMVVSVTSTRVCSPASSRRRPSGPARRAAAWCRARGAAAKARRLRRARLGRRPGAAARLGMAVDGDVGDVGQQLGRAVAALVELEQLGRLVDEARRVVVGAEFRVRRARPRGRRGWWRRRGCDIRAAPGPCGRSPPAASAPRPSPSPAAGRSSG